MLPARSVAPRYDMPAAGAYCCCQRAAMRVRVDKGSAMRAMRYQALLYASRFAKDVATIIAPPAIRHAAAYALRSLFAH